MHQCTEPSQKPQNPYCSAPEKSKQTSSQTHNASIQEVWVVLGQLM